MSNLKHFNTGTMPKHLVELFEKLEAKEQDFGFTMTDVTPAGYGPDDQEVTTVINFIDGEEI